MSEAIMDEDEFKFELERLVEAGLCQKHGQDKFSLTDAGKDYFESIIMGGVEVREHVYALGRLQGLREAENRYPLLTIKDA